MVGLIQTEWLLFYNRELSPLLLAAKQFNMEKVPSSYQRKTECLKQSPRSKKTVALTSDILENGSCASWSQLSSDGAGL